MDSTELKKAFGNIYWRGKQENEMIHSYCFCIYSSAKNKKTISLSSVFREIQAN